MTTQLEPGMVKPGFALSADLASFRSIFIGTVHELPFIPPNNGPMIYAYGQVLTISDYPQLAAKYGTRYGGNGVTTFGVPDLRGRVVAGVDNMGGASANRLTAQTGGLNGDILGAVGGTEIHVLTTLQMPTHTVSGTTEDGGEHDHAQRGSGSPGGTTTAQYSGTLTGASEQGTRTATSGNHFHPFESDPVGGDQGHNNVQPTIALYKCILAF